ncbi:sensor histidine kinase, partial [Actinomadura kijaniata]|uniref:sensor histidine kinase n=1 Tax=Actinomadura kijaniata TaxID=46161 RepID=UPI003F1AF3A1
AAASEVEDYTRVSVAPMPEAAIAGVAVTDVVHLLAELVENATAFSPPHTTVQVTGELVGHGFSIEIEDRGLGMDEAALAAANARLAAPPEFDLSDSAQLGLFVVGRLAQRHNIRVTLRTSPFGGTTAIVLLPDELVVLSERPGADRTPFALTRRGADALIPAGVVRGRRHAPELPAAPPERYVTAFPEPVGRPEPAAYPESTGHSENIGHSENAGYPENTGYPEPAGHPAPAAYPRNTGFPGPEETPE